jgi:hypothetical protein
VDRLRQLANKRNKNLVGRLPTSEWIGKSYCRTRFDVGSERVKVILPVPLLQLFGTVTMCVVAVNGIFFNLVVIFCPAFQFSNDIRTKTVLLLFRSEVI